VDEEVSVERSRYDYKDMLSETRGWSCDIVLNVLFPNEDKSDDTKLSFYDACEDVNKPSGCTAGNFLTS
jgi:hypothetical protein